MSHKYTDEEFEIYCKVQSALREEAIRELFENEDVKMSKQEFMKLLADVDSLTDKGYEEEEAVQESLRKYSIEEEEND